MLQQQANQQLLDFLKQSIRLGEKIMAANELHDELFAEYNERLAELIEYLKAHRSGMNLLVSWKIDSFEVYAPAKDYRPDWNKFLNIIGAAKKEPHNNVVAYIKKQNLLMGAIEFYYRHQ
jgi:hypothetical protein